MDTHRHSYIRTIFVKFRMGESRSVATPIAMKLQMGMPGEEGCDLIISQSLIGSLIQAMTATWPDIAYANVVLRRYNHDPSNYHMVALTLLFRYLYGMKDFPLYVGGTQEGETAHKCYVNSGYAGCPNDY
jgi:hypothetical protein